MLTRTSGSRTIRACLYLLAGIWLVTPTGHSCAEDEEPILARWTGTMSYEVVHRIYHQWCEPALRTETYRVVLHGSLLERGSDAAATLAFERVRLRETFTRTPDRQRGRGDLWHIYPPVPPFEISAAHDELPTDFREHCGWIWRESDDLKTPGDRLFRLVITGPAHFEEYSQRELPVTVNEFHGDGASVLEPSRVEQHFPRNFYGAEIGHVDPALSDSDPQKRRVQSHMRGEFQREWVPGEGVHDDGPDDRKTLTVRWDLRRIPAELPELVVTIPGYHAWRPAANRGKPATPGNTIQVHAELRRSPGSKEPVPRAERMTFELLDVSREPGIAINFSPVTGSPVPRYDLRFDSSANSDVFVTDEQGLTAETHSGGHCREATAVIAAYDWGAFGSLRVTAHMPGGEEIVGYLDDYFLTDILLPRRDPESKIASIWKERNGIDGLADDDDAEFTPNNDHKGDGLSLYEEYRGFYVNGRHFEGDPGTKDCFIRVENEARNRRTRMGIKLFGAVTGSTVHYLLRDSEIERDAAGAAVINFNHGSEQLHNGDQLAACIAHETPPNDLLAGHANPETRVITLNLNGVGAYNHKTVAHELLHACAVPHHGDDDIGFVRWRVVTEDDGSDVVLERSYDRNGRLMAEIREVEVLSRINDREFGEVAPGFIRRFPRHIWVAVPRGQHSGQHDCLMRYFIARAIAPSPTSNQRYLWLGGERGAALCESNHGTGLNTLPATQGVIKPRAGEATVGDCQSRVRIRSYATASESQP